jgi:Protein of unknown function (DUF3465)
MKKLLLPVIVFAAIAIFGYGRDYTFFSGAPTSAAAANDNDSVFASAFEKHASNIQVEGRGTVVKILPDDNDGSRHQRFIVRLSSGQTILIAHNIDLAPRVSSLSEGDVISFGGEYEWSPKGGVVHWTHRDPNGRHPAGWIRRGGQSFQ